MISTAAPAQQTKWAYAALTIASNKAIVDSGATQIFVMDGMPVHNKQKWCVHALIEAITGSGATQIFVMDGMPVHNERNMTCPPKVALADGRWVMSAHMCDIIVPGLPTTLIGHIVPELSIASLFGIRVLTEAG